MIKVYTRLTQTKKALRKQKTEESKMRLHEQVAVQKETIAQYEEMIANLMRYLHSDKFSSDVSVNKNDILSRIELI